MRFNMEWACQSILMEVFGLTMLNTRSLVTYARQSKETGNKDNVPSMPELIIQRSAAVRKTMSLFQKLTIILVSITMFCTVIANNTRPHKVTKYVFDKETPGIPVLFIPVL